MGPPVPDDGDAWRWLAGAAGAVVAAVWGVVRWLLGRIETVRLEAREERVATETKLEKALADHRAEAMGWHNSATGFRETVLSTMVTRTELDRQLDRQRDELLERLDARITPLLPRRGAGN